MKGLHMAGLQIRAVEVEASAPQASLLARPWVAHLTDRPTENFGETLGSLCAQLAGPFAEMSGITLTCTAEQQRILEPVAAELRAIALGLIASAHNSFRGGRGGRIAVRFHVAATELELTVEHSGPGTWLARDEARAAATREERLVTRLGGKLVTLRMIGGVHIVVTLPRR